jgi:solute carrier family 8 (sodium/calcium exchanger)
VVEPWEGAATFLFFPLLLALAYLADQGVLACPDCSAKKGGTGPARSRSTTVIVSEHENRGAGARSRNKSTAYYRVNATRNLTGGRSIESASEEQLSGMTVTVQEEQSEVFELSAANVLVNAEDDTAKVVVFRSGKVSSAASVEYTILSKARGAKSATSVVEFHPNQQSATILVELLEEDHALKEGGAPAFEVALRPPPPPAKLGSRSKCAVRAISSDSAGVFVLVDEELRVREEDKKAVLTVRRQDGSKGRVSCMVNTHDGTAVAPADYLAVEDLELVFEEGVVERSVEVTIINDDQYEGDETFEVEFSEASNGASFSLDCDGGPEKALATVTIIGDEPTEGCPANCTELAVRLGVNVDASRLVVVLWAQQFDEALTLDEDTGCIGLVMFLLSIPWKLGCALAPPPRLWNGWASFFVVLALIGVLTAFIGDLASNLGCCLGISKSITAITFVALGTSLPDTFASMTAAASEDTADASIGNITGSNSVNVFLGLGLPWTIAAVYWSYYGSGEEDAWRARYAAEPWYDASMPLGFAVPAGELGFSVLVFTVCALICLGTLMLRRVLLGYELGFAMQLPTAIFFVMLWLAYITACVWNSA